jgi:Mg2+ and Co2+ transporter CorA
LEERFTCDPDLVNAAAGNCFLVLGDVYRIVASNWIVLDQYINRELATIEYILEKYEPGFRQLETYLKEMYMHRRRCTKYLELIGEAKQQCHNRGQASWPRTSDQGSEIVSHLVQDLEQDLSYMQAKTQGTAQRTEKNIQLLTALVSIGEGKQALDENHGVGRLTLLAMVFLPFSTVGTILGIHTMYGPGQDSFWLFWAISIPLTAFILIATFLFNKFGATFVSSSGYGKI